MVEVEVEFDYEANMADELSIRAGDIITDVKQMDGGWWEGMLKGKRGVFPDNFVKVLSKGGLKEPITSASPDNDEEDPDLSANGVELRKRSLSDRNSISGQQCRVMFSYSPAHDDELELQLDDIIDILGEVEDGWWRGTLNGKIGVFPSNFVELITNTNLSNNPKPAMKDSIKNLKNENLKEKTTKSSLKMGLIQEMEAKSKLSGVGCESQKLKDVPPSAENSIKTINVGKISHQKRQSPLGKEAVATPGKKTPLISSVALNNSNTGLAHAPKLPPKPRERYIPPKNAANERQAVLGSEQDGLVAKYPSSFLIHRADSFLLMNDDAQLEFKSSCDKLPSHVDLQFCGNTVQEHRIPLRKRLLKSFSVRNLFRKKLPSQTGLDEVIREERLGVSFSKRRRSSLLQGLQSSFRRRRRESQQHRYQSPLTDAASMPQLDMSHQGLGQFHQPIRTCSSEKYLIRSRKIRNKLRGSKVNSNSSFSICSKKTEVSLSRRSSSVSSTSFQHFGFRRIVDPDEFSGCAPGLDVSVVDYHYDDVDFNQLKRNRIITNVKAFINLKRRSS